MVFLTLGFACGEQLYDKSQIEIHELHTSILVLDEFLPLLGVGPPLPQMRPSCSFVIRTLPQDRLVRRSISFPLHPVKVYGAR